MKNFFKIINVFVLSVAAFLFACSGDGTIKHGCDEDECTEPPGDIGGYDLPGDCEDGGCRGEDPCEGVRCDSAPAYECISEWVMRAYSTPGTCSDGVCSYEFDDTYCPNGCESGRCIGDPCHEVKCDAPPANECMDGHSLRRYEAEGVCSDGQCIYGYEDVNCEQGSSCSLGQCVADCIPDCGDRQCGPDGCGGYCGNCDTGTECSDGNCSEPVCNGGYNCLKNGIISYHGAEINGQFVSWLYLLDDWFEYKAQVIEDFRDIRLRFHAKGVRLLLHTENKTWTGQPGLDFPSPSTSQISSIRDTIDAAAGLGLEVVLVVLLPEDYRRRHPDELDDFYALNNQILQSNLFTYWDDIFNGVLATIGPDGRKRIDHVMFIDIFGDFDPIDVYDQMTEEEQYNQQEWFRRIWPNFYSWYDFIPRQKKSFELIGGVSNPPLFIEEEISWVKQEIEQHGFPNLPFYSIEAYACTSWTGAYNNAWDAYRDLFLRSASAAGGIDHLVVEEIGINRCQDCTNDLAEGENTFSAALSAIQSIDSSIPVGIWAYHDSPSCSTNGLWGLIKTDETPIDGWWVIPYYFGN